MLEGWVRNGDVRIHYLDNTGSSNENIPLVMVPGLAETGEDYSDILEALLPRRVIVITMRGRGQSDTPHHGYTLRDHAEDISSVINHVDIGKFVLFGYGAGVIYSLRYAADHMRQISGIIIGDYPAVSLDFQEGWSEFFAKIPGRHGNVLDRMTMETLKEIEKDSEEVSFLEDLKNMDFPVLILRSSSGKAGLTEEGAKEYLAAVPDGRIRILDEDGEEPVAEEFVKTLDDFFQEIER
jgi:pimeloyl-ACP methyl ester carboxylesterase